MSNSTALLTDRYEFTMLDAALNDGTAQKQCAFEVFARRLPGGRRFGVFAGLGRLLELIREFRFTDEQLRYLSDNKIVSPATLDYLKNYKFQGDVKSYAEGELYFPQSPLLTIQSSFADAVLLETLVLSVLNYDSAVATAASRMVMAAGDRPLAEMGSRRTGEQSAVAAARAAYIAGFSATSNVEAGMKWGIPTMGTAAHAWTLLHDSEEEAFRSQIATLGKETTLLVDTYDIDQGIKNALAAAGPQLGGIRIDSGDLPIVVAEARQLLDDRGARDTKITVTSDLDEYAIASLAASPVDAYGVGTSLVTGSGYPAAGMVYKLVSSKNAAGEWIPLSKTAEHKSSKGGRKRAWRQLDDGVAVAEIITLEDCHEHDPHVPDARALQIDAIVQGEIDKKFEGKAGTELAKEQNAYSRSELPVRALALSRGNPAIETLLQKCETT